MSLLPELVRVIDRGAINMTRLRRFWRPFRFGNTPSTF